MERRLPIVGIAALPLVAARGEFGLGDLLVWALVGLVVGALARLVVPGPSNLGILATILIGIAGALLGGWLATMIGATGIVTWIVAVLVAAALVWVLGRFGTGRTRY